MSTTYHAVMRNGKVELLQPAELPEGTPLLVTALEDEDRQFWEAVGRSSLDAIWDNPEDDIYADLLKE